MSNRVTRARRLLDALMGWVHKHPKSDRAGRIRKARKALSPPAPKVKVYPQIKAAREQSANGPQFGVGECMMRVRMCYGIPAVNPDAATAWRNARVKHGPRTKAPRGYPVFWTGGSHGFGHVAIATGDGNCWSTDIKRPGFFDLCPISEINARWGLTYVGWAEDLNGVPIK